MAQKPQDNSPQGNAARERIAAQQRENRRNWRGKVEPADWGDANPDLISRCVSVLSGRGHAIQFSYTRDGGSYVVRIVGDGEPYNEYVRPSEDIDLYLTYLIEKYGS